MNPSMSPKPDSVYPSFRSRPERPALILVLLAVLGIPLVIWSYQSVLRPRLSPERTIELVGRLPTSERGGWTPDTITVVMGERVRLRITSADVVHGFAVPKLGIETSTWVEPGKVQEIVFTADQPGRYEFMCTVWCEAGHWRMRGIIEVIDPNDSLAAERDISPPTTNWMETGIDIDAEHLAAVAPASPPHARDGAELWALIGDRPLLAYFADVDLRLLAPADAFARMSQPGTALASLTAGLTDGERWDLVAYLWAQRTTPQQLARGEQLYQRDCTGCHGVDGRADGPGARPDLTITAGSDMARPATDFSDLQAQAGAADMIYYGKLVRGGMGTTMPYWSGLYTEEDLWAVIAYIRSFAFSD